MTKDRLKYLLERYLENTATPEELQEYNDWYSQQADAPDEELFDDKYSRQLFDGIMSRIGALEKNNMTREPVAGKKYIPYIKWAAAALVAGAIFTLYNSIRTKPVTTVARRESLQGATKPELVTIENTGNERMLIRLKDGSLAALFAGSKLSFRKPFNTGDRHVYLSGKGFFDVAKDAARPFTVYSHGVSTTALGTSFTVTAYAGKNEVTVALHKGRVVVRDSAAAGPDSKEIYLLPGQQVACNVAGGTTVFRQVTAIDGPYGTKERVTGAGSLTGFAATFDQAPVDTVLNTIARGYGVPIKYDQKKMSAMIFSGSIRETDSLSQVLKRIAVLYNLSVKPDGQHFIIRKSH